jgi:hypothetical protein
VVSDLWHPNTHHWNHDLIDIIFDNEAAQIISQVIMVDSASHDTLRWIPAKRGDCTTKNIHMSLSSQAQVQLPTIGSMSILPQANRILYRMWKSRSLAPLIKAFTWCLVRRALATGHRAARSSQHIDDHCTHCNIIETDAHLFFYCNFARAIWFSATPPIRSDDLPQEDDRVQVILSMLITDSVDDHLMQKILTTMWFLRKARNDQRFRAKTWKIWQVHHAVAALIATTNLTLSTVHSRALTTVTTQCQ